MTWQFSIDVGGTFTDCIAVSPSGRSTRLKVLSSAVTKGAIEQLESYGFRDSSRSEAVDFWNGYSVRCF